MSPAHQTVLVVDNDQAICDVLQQALEFEGYSVKCALLSADALEAIRTGGIDLVILDLRMAYPDGLVVCRSVRDLERERGGHLPIIVQSAAGDGERESALAAGADQYVTKPFDLDQLLELVASYLPTPAS